MRLANTSSPELSGKKPLRLLVVCPSWVGDAVMATPALRLVRSALPGAYIGGLMRPGLEEVLAGAEPAFFDEVHVYRARGVMGPKLVAGKIRPRRYDTALLLTNSFSTALITRLAFIPRRVGYDRDGRGLLLTDRIRAERGSGGGFKVVSAVDYYLRAAGYLVGDFVPTGMRMPALELGVTAEQAAAAAKILESAGVQGSAYAVINPGANNPAKRWASERFGRVAAWLVRERGLKVLVSGSPGEVEVCDAVVRAAAEHGTTEGVVSLTGLGLTIGSLKGIVRGARVMLTNDTGPRHIAAAFGVPVVTLFGPTDPRWTRLPESTGKQVEIVADPTLPPELVADDHPERCSMDKIEVERVVEALREAIDSHR